MTADEIAALERKARWVRRTSLEMVVDAGKGHLGSSYSCTDLLVALYYGGVLRVDPKNPHWPDRDRLVMGKGHACQPVFSILLDLGFISQARFAEYGKEGGSLGGQFDVSIPGAESNTGSLGHGLSLGAGMALAAKLDRKDYKTYVLMGDAECSEGSVWEAVIFASQMRLDNLIGIIDRNRLSVLDVLDDEPAFGNYEAKLQAFGWSCATIDGHSFRDILAALRQAAAADRPTMIVADTIKGKGISFMEHDAKWHHLVPAGADLELARQELSVDRP